MSLFMQAEAVLLVIFAGFLSMIIGMDRERHDNPAGLRTHMLVGIGSCLFTILSSYGFGNSDASRVAAAVVQGIGFIGAGTVMVRQGTVKGLTTAASVWTTSAIGMTVGVGAWLLALGVTLLVWFILAIIRRLENRPAEASLGAAKARGPA